MTRFFRFSPSRMASAYIALTVLVLALFAIPLWYAWNVNLGTFKAYVNDEDVQRMTATFEREGAAGLAAQITSGLEGLPDDEFVILADASKSRIAGNLPMWPKEVPDAPGTYGLAIDHAGSTMRWVGSHIALPGGYHLLVGRESARFQSLVGLFWAGIAVAVGIALVLGAIIGWVGRRALLFEVHEITRTAAAIVNGRSSRRIEMRGRSSELDTLARTVNGMLEQLASQNVQLEREISVRRDAEQALHRAQDELEELVAQRTEQLARVNESLRRSEARFALAVDAAGDGHSDWIVATDEFYASPRLLEMAGLPAATTFNGREDFLAKFPFHPEDRARVIDAVSSHFAANTLRLEIEMRVLRRGEIRWHHLTGLCSRDASGALVRWNAVVTDVTERKCAEVALLLSEERYARAMEASEEGHWEWNLTTDAMFLSARVKEMLGLASGAHFASREEFFAQQPIHPDDRARVREAREAVLADSAQRYEIEYRIVPRPGEVRWVRTRGKVFRDPDDGTLRITGTVSDITARKSAEDALRLSEHRYALAMEATGDGHWDWNIPVDKVYVSPLLLDICGLPPDSTFASRADWVAKFPFYPGEGGRYAQAVAEHFAGKTDRVDADIRILPRGELRWIHMTGRCSRDASGMPIRWAGSVTDITARKRVDEELRARQDMLDLAQKAARAVAFEWRIGGEEGENRWSPDLEAMYGIAAGSYDGTYATWKTLVHPDDWPQVRAAIEEAQATGDVAAEYRVVHKGGSIRGESVRWLQARGRMFLDPAGKPSRVVGFMMDVTDRRQAEEELRRMELQLRQVQRLEAMGTLAGGIAHDFNNLLGAILGYGEMALRDAPDGSRLRRDLDSIIIAGERGRALVDRILAFSRSGVGERVAVHVEEVVRETVLLFAANLSHGMTIDSRLRAGRAAVMGDATQIHQVLMNLVTNAVQAMSPGGELIVSLNTVVIDAPRNATTGTIAARDYVVLKVADTGSGIPAEVLDRIFDPFFTTKEIGVGTGLGLSLVHGIVTGLGGVIEVESTVGEGSVFTVYLPRAGDVSPVRTGARRAQPGQPRGNGQCVLIVDDEASLVTLATETLTELGYLPVGFTHSVAALEAFVANPESFDALITDESMPGMSGSELIRKVRKIRPAIPILLVSGYLSAAVVRRARDAGADAVLKKPLSARLLATNLASVLHAAASPPSHKGAVLPTARSSAKAPRRAEHSPSRAQSKRRRA